MELLLPSPDRLLVHVPGSGRCRDGNKRSQAGYLFGNATRFIRAYSCPLFQICDTIDSTRERVRHWNVNCVVSNEGNEVGLFWSTEMMPEMVENKRRLIKGLRAWHGSQALRAGSRGVWLSRPLSGDAGVVVVREWLRSLLEADRRRVGRVMRCRFDVFVLLK